MLLIQRVTANAKQSQNLVLSNGVQFTLSLYFSPIQLGWFIDELTYQDFTVKGLRIVNSPNMLRQWQNLIPFGLACFSTNNREPSLQKDFATGQSKLYVLTEAEVQEFSEYLALG